MAGFFVTFEGGEGAGKSTQARLLAAIVAKTGREVVSTREPGGCPGAEQIRQLLVTGDADRWSARAEALLNYAARDAHLDGLIRPALARDAIVICDRFMDSTRAYQGYAGGVDLEFIDALECQVVAATRPDLTFVFDLDARAGLERARARGGDDRYERKGLAFHEKLRKGFAAIAAGASARCVLVDAARPVDDVAAEIAGVVMQRAGLS